VRAPLTTTKKVTTSTSTVKRSVSKKKTYAAAPAARNTARGAQITVHSGDTLGKLAQRYHVAGGWEALWKANGARVTNPNLIFVGQVLRLP
jgi:nucleoid-associated protein YgaU